MSEYFNNFPRILYDIEGKNSTTPEYEVAVNIMIRQKFRDAISDEVTQFYPYIIPDEMKRPDILAHRQYGDVRYTWVIFLINNMHDPYWNWPMDARNFKSFMDNKYGSIDQSKIIVHHYEKIINARVESTGTADPIPERTVEIDYETYRELVRDEDSRKIIYSYEYEVDKNEANRSIKLVDASFVSSVLDEARQTFR